MRSLALALLPIASAWVRRQEKMIQRQGKPLNEDQIADARRIGVAQPERVRILVVKTIPPRLSRPIAALAARLGLAPSSTIGLALGYGIFLRADFATSRALLLHELAHTAQYERLGFRPFLAQYLHECLAGGYPNGALEREAQRLATEFSNGGDYCAACTSAPASGSGRGDFQKA